VYDGLVASGRHTIAVCSADLSYGYFEDEAAIGGRDDESIRKPVPVPLSDESTARLQVEAKSDDTRPESGLLQVPETRSADGVPLVELMLHTLLRSG
jgi:hypothetical protein